MAIHDLDGVLIVEEDPEVGIALSVLLTAAGHGVETTFHDNTILLDIEFDSAEVRFLHGHAPYLKAHELAQRLRERLKNPLLTDVTPGPEGHAWQASDFREWFEQSEITEVKAGIPRKIFPETRKKVSKNVA